MNGIQLFKIIKSILTIGVLIFNVLPIFFLNFFWAILLPFKGFFSKSIRYCIIKGKAKSIGDNLSIGANTIIKNWKNFSCVDNVSINETCIIDCDGKIKIGDNVSIVHATSLVVANHTWDKILVPINILH